MLVAHNAGFDIGFLRAAAERCQITWPRPPVLCTVRLARRVLTRDEAPSVRLSALARLFGASTTPNHRALDDARATVDVLHALIERVGNQGVHTYAELRSYLPDVTPAQRRNRHLADGAAAPCPACTCSAGPRREVLYVGTAVDLRRRVSQYFNGADPRTRIKEMASLATAVDHVECAHDLEAGVRELRLLAAHAPPYNRRSKFPHRWWWVVLTDEAFPRFSVVRAPASTTARSGRSARAPTRSRRPPARPVHRRAHMYDAAGPLRAARAALPRTRGVAVPGRRATSSAADYAAAPCAPRDRLIDGADSRRTAPRRCRTSPISPDRGRYETAARLRDHAATAIEVLWRGQRLRALAAVDELVAARPGRRRRMAPGGHPPRPAGRGGQRARAACPRCPSSTRYALAHKRFCRRRRRWAAHSSRRPR